MAFEFYHLAGSGGIMFILDIVKPLLGAKVTLPAELNSVPAGITSKV